MKEEKRRGKRRKFFAIFIGLFLMVLICSAPWWGCRVFCYDSTVAHPNIAQLAALLYNKTYPDKKLTSEEINWIVVGAEKEDTPTRWLNHFYDPVHNTGLSFEKQHLSAKDWAVSPGTQIDYALGDKSWPRAIADFNKGDREDAFVELGHVLHLIADMSVPAHTRADIHVMPGDSYESYVKLNWNAIQKQINSQFIGVSSLNQAFDDLANYSNNNFYSDDTIENDNYDKIKILKSDLVKGFDNIFYKFYFSKDEFGNFYKIYFNKNVFGWQNVLNSTSKIEKNLKHDDVDLDYSTHLIPKAVGYSAGVIKLFFSEAEKNAKIDLPKDRVSIWGWGNKILGWGIGVADNAKNYLTNKFGENDQVVELAPAIVVPVEEVGQRSLQDESQGIPPLAVYPDRSVGGRNDNEIQPPPPVKKVLGEKIVAPVIVNDDVVVPPVQVNNDSYSGSGTTATTTTTSATTTPPLDPPQGEGDSATSTTATSTPEADPCTSGETSCDTQSSSTPWNDSPDLNPPTIPVITFTEPSPDLDYNLVITVTSTDASSSVVYFDLEYLVGAPSSTPSSTWQVLVASSTATVYHFTAEANQKYLWRARARDQAGNISDWMPEKLYIGQIIFGRQVVINEVAWAGTAGFPASLANDKWLELYNNTDQPINIAGWKLYIGDRTLFPVKITTTTISPHGYYLLERSLGDTWNLNSSDDTVSDIPGDYVFYFDNNNFKATGERLRLVDATGKIIDEVDCSNGWFTNNADGMYRTMERINSRTSGNDPNNWQSSHGPRPLGRGRGGVTIYGSPRQSNVGNIVLAGNQIENSVTLTTADNPYIVSAYVVPVGKTLVVEPGVVIKARYQSSPLRVAGRVEIKGTVDSPVIITSGRDQTFVDPQLNTIFGTWTAGPAQARDWQGLWFDPGAVGEIAGLELRYAGYKFKSPREDHWFGSLVEQSIRVDGATLNISDSNILNNGNVSLYLENATTTIQNTKIDQGITAVNALDSIISLDNVKMFNFSGANGPVDIVRSFPSLKNLQLENNQFNGVHLENTIFKGDTTLGKELAWYMVNPTVSTGATLRLDPGTKIFLLNQGGMEIAGGNLLAKGTVDEPVEIAPFDNVSNWGMLHFTNSNSVLENVRLIRGNNNSSRSKGIITVANSQLQLKNVVMDRLHSGYNIIKSEDSQLDLENVNLGYDVKPGIESCAVDIKNGTLKLRSVSFKNLNYGLYALLASLPDLDMDPLDLLDKFQNVDVPMLPSYPWVKAPSPPPLIP